MVDGNVKWCGCFEDYFGISNNAKHVYYIT